MSEEISPGGSEIYRHEAAPLPEERGVSAGDERLIEAVGAHLDRCFGDAERWVFHEIVSPTVHVDIHAVHDRETGLRRLVTSGMAELPMTVPEGFPESPYAELTIALPEDWPLDEGAFADERVYWPLRLLKILARMTHDYSTFLWHGHTIPNGDPPQQYARGTDLCCALIAAPILAPDGFETFAVGDGRSVRYLAVIPLHEEEMRLKLEQGAGALGALLGEREVLDRVDPERASVVAKRRRFGWRR